MDELQPPTTVKEIGIHLLYMRQGMDNLNEKMGGLSTKEHVDSVQKEVNKQGIRIEDLEKKRLVRDVIIPIGLILSVLINTIAFYKLITGGV